MESDLYPASYYLGGGASNYANYGDDPGWSVTARTLQELLRLGPAQRILEVGCATGWFVLHALSHGLNVEGIDISQWAIDHPAPGVRQFIRQGSVVDLELYYPHADFDVVCSWEMLEHVPEDQVDAALDSMLMVTAPDGLWIHRIALDDAHHDHNAHDDETHFTIKSREWWDSKIREDIGGVRVPYIEEALDSAFEGRDWAGRFFAYRV